LGFFPKDKELWSFSMRPLTLFSLIGRLEDGRPKTGEFTNSYVASSIILAERLIILIKINPKSIDMR